MLFSAPSPGGELETRGGIVFILLVREVKPSLTMEASLQATFETQAVKNRLSAIIDNFDP